MRDMDPRSLIVLIAGVLFVAGAAMMAVAFMLKP
jgi:hypothetical protein